MMKIVVCVRQGLDGELGPFDASAYEAALRMENAEVTLLSMAPVSAKDFLLSLTRLGAKKAVLLSDKAFAGADTLATAYALSLAIKKLSPDLVLCGRQTLIGDTAQTGAMLSVLSELSLVTNVMNFDGLGDGRLRCRTRGEGEVETKLPALLTMEKSYTLRLPRLRSRLGEVEILDAMALGADVDRCGLMGSPTRVIKTFENQSGKRKCKFISRQELSAVIGEALGKHFESPVPQRLSDDKLSGVCIVGEAPRAFAETVAEDIMVIPLTDEREIAERIKALDPSAVLWGSDARSKRLAAMVAARLGLGLCADCTLLACEDGELMMYRPALSGRIIAKIKSLTRPAMATVRTDDGGAQNVIVTAGFGVRDKIAQVRAFADAIDARLCATRKLVDGGYANYEMQVGLTGNTVSPPVYIAIGVSGAVHHIVGMERSGTVIAINPDRDAPIFDYADYGILEKF